MKYTHFIFALQVQQVYQVRYQARYQSTYQVSYQARYIQWAKLLPTVSCWAQVCCIRWAEVSLR